MFPYHEDFLFHRYDRQKKVFSIGTKRSLTIKEITIDRPLEDRLFQEPLTEGANVSDQIHDPPLYYKYKAKFRPEEWQKIVKEAEDRDAEGALHRQRVAKLIGKPAPALPTEEWLNSKPLTWADLHGKIVVLKFWSIGCGPCYNDLSILSDPYNPGKSPQDNEKKAGELPIVFIGVHAPGNIREEIEKVLKKHKLGAPICIDCAGPGKAAWGEFFAQCEIRGMPTYVAVDEEGRYLAERTWLSEIMEDVARHRDAVSEKKNSTKAPASGH